MEDSRRGSRKIVLYGILAVVLIVVIGIIAATVVSVKMSAGGFPAAVEIRTPGAKASTKASQDIAKKTLWHGRDVHESGKGIGAGMWPERACDQLGAETVYWVTTGYGPTVTTSCSADSIWAIPGSGSSERRRTIFFIRCLLPFHLN